MRPDCQQPGDHRSPATAGFARPIRRAAGRPRQPLAPRRATTAAGATALDASATSTPATTAAAPPAALPNNGNPWFISAQGMGNGSIDASSVSSFLVTCNQYAAGAIAGALQAGNSPFTVHYNLTLMFYMNACQIQMDVNVDKVFTQLSAAAEAKYMVCAGRSLSQLSVLHHQRRHHHDHQ